ncbi:MAG: hypothetical protein HYY40_07820 [Bacteroidetes bacterium]|nr:hypothetical protein [Bacteroidota bacterium]
MIIDFIQSAIKNIKERIKNPFTERNTTPFAGAFFIALVLWNWELFYSLFQFDKDCTRIDKILIIETYLSKGFYKIIIIPLILSFVSITAYYFFNNISLGITTFFNR